MRLMFLFVFVATLAYSQDCASVSLTGKVVDTLRLQSFYNLVIVNNSTGKGVFGLANGQFQLYVKEGDEITFSIRDYTSVKYTVRADENCQARKIFYIERKPQEIQEVIVRPLKTLEQIKEERSSLAMREVQQVRGLQIFQSPITALYQAFSRKEKNKRIIAQKQYEDKQKAVLQELLRLYVAYDIIELDEETFDDFIAFLNVDEDFLKTASEMELVTFVQDKYEHFRSLMKGK